MQSTGEVIGIHRDPRVALAKALRGASLIPPRAGVGDGAIAPVALLSIADRDKGGLARLAAALIGAGYRLMATPGTRDELARHGVAADPVAKLGTDPTAAPTMPGILDVIASGEVRLVVNTPTPRSGAVRDAAEALDPVIQGQLADVRSLVGWVPLVGPRPAQEPSMNRA